MTLSMGATTVLETAAETPPIRKSVMKLFLALGAAAGADILQVSV